jgi:hypothetical protein
MQVAVVRIVTEVIRLAIFDRVGRSPIDHISVVLISKTVGYHIVVPMQLGWPNALFFSFPSTRRSAEGPVTV